ncbi:MalY/PatB family protein [Ferrimonas lipolytica]|uniref:cysteine-S-conjugate beta-lyase n=1 Tax=Ferrimonas lipolytica TaxID=2724191 RepID=A0A6H1UGW6_9GAMM|nr:PatB family C-S lyase [Ferrimonas lipolytica]QIZ77456.1 putative C-S lyase [Ferrimonas lipolytica]
MTQFNPLSSYGQNSFIKSKPSMLTGIYGSTDVFPYWVADMDFKVAEPISSELKRLVDRGVYSYEFNQDALFQAMVSWFERRHHLMLSADNFVQVPGVLSGIALLLNQFTEVGDAVLIHTPAYHQFSNLISKAERTVVTSPLTLVNDQYQIDFKGMEQQIQQQQVKAMILCNPHNPTGRVWSKAELTQLVAIAKRYDVLIISDEIHSDIIFAGHQFTSMASFDYPKAITLLGSPAKTFGMHSISNGYIYAGNSELLGVIKHQVSAMYLDHGNAFSTFATIVAYQQAEQWLDGLLAYLQQTVNWITAFVSQHINGLKVFQPQGTYQLWFDFSGLELSQQQLNMVLFEQAKMGLTPGAWFGESNPNFMRMNIATARENIIASFELLRDAIDNVEEKLTAANKCQGDRSADQGCC